MTPPHRPWQAVRISSAPERLAELDAALEAMAAAVGDVPALLAAAHQAGRFAPRPGEGETARLWELLASVAAIDVAAARILEPHLDAGAILAQAGAAGSFTGTWGVFAAEAPGTRLTAVPQPGGQQSAGQQPGSEPARGEQPPSEQGGVRLSGSKPWCSLAQFVDHAVVTAHTRAGGRAAFAVDLRDAGVTCTDPEWTSRGLREIPSGTVHFDSVPAMSLGGEGWYFRRPGFAWGGMGVAACWLGGAVALGRHFRQALLRGAQAGREPDQVALASLGEVDRILSSAIQCLARTAELVDGRLHGHAELQEEPGADGASGAWSEALRVRGTVAAAVERVQLLVGQNLGPGPLAFDERYGKCMADLSLYVRQHHALRDDAQLGALTLKGELEW